MGTGTPPDVGAAGNHGYSATPANRPFTVGHWVAWTAAAEATGFLAPVAGFALTGALGTPPWATYVVLVGAGAIEGTFLGLGQARALRGTSGHVPQGPWTALTAAAAAFAWAIGMLPSTLVDLGVAVSWARPGTWLAVGFGGLALLASLPTAQWTVLRRVLPRAWRWIPLTMGAWLAGLVFTFLPSPFVDEASPGWLTASLFIAGGVTMALTAATLMGLGLRRLLSDRDRS